MRFPKRKPRPRPRKPRTTIGSQLGINVVAKDEKTEQILREMKRERTYVRDDGTVWRRTIDGKIMYLGTLAEAWQELG